MAIFKRGEAYNRRSQVHGQLGGQSQGGISTPSGHPYVLLFTSDAGEAYGYSDSFRPDGTFWYTGEGQVGDMEMVRGNLAIAKHQELGKQLLLFEYVASGTVRFIGEAEYLGHHREERPDRDGRPRQALIFHLGILPPGAMQPQPPILALAGGPRLPRRLSLEDLRRVAVETTPKGSSPQERIVNVIRRSAAVRQYALARAKGTCEGCDEPAPFPTREGPYLEVHHVFRVSDGGPDHPAGVVALCPTCHRRAHHAIDAQLFNQGLVDWLLAREGPIPDSEDSPA